MTQAVRTLMSGLIDYAGLFPPAKLDMAPAAEAFARARAGLHEWVLGRFICPAAHLGELSRAAAALMPGTFATSGYREHAGNSEAWHVSVTVDGPAGLAAALAAMDEFNARHAEEDRGLAVADALEMKVSTAGEIDAAIEAVPDEVFPFFEVPIAGDCRGLVAALSGTAAAAKVRTGGVTVEAFPAPPQVASFLAACAAADVPFKATAGLHHPVRGEYPLTYEPGCPRATMYGFVNLFIAAALVRARRADEAEAAAILGERDPTAFKFTDEGVRWRGRFLESAELARVREVFALSYGSCSFDEPIDDLKKLGLL